MKTKVRTSQQNEFTPTSEIISGNWRVVNPAATIPRTKLEEISYETGPLGYIFKECDHNVATNLDPRYRVGSHSVVTSFTYGWGSINDLYDGKMPTYLTLDPKEVVPNAGYRDFYPSSSDIAAARETAYTKLLNLDDKENPLAGGNLALSLIELKDMKMTLRPLIDLVAWACQTGPLRPYSKAIPLAVLLTKSVAQVANYYLTYAFGIAPIKSDLDKYRDELSKGRLLTQGNPIQHRAESTIVSRYVAKSQFSPRSMARGDVYKTWIGYHPLWGYMPSVSIPVLGLPPWDRNNLPYSYGEVANARVTKVSGAYFAKLVLDYEQTEAQTLLRKFLYRSPLLKTGWELIPFSFILDWFLDIGDQIARIERRFLSTFTAQFLGPIWRGERTLTEVYPLKGQYVGYLSDVEPINWSSDNTDLSSGHMVNLTFTRRSTLSFDKPVLVSKNYARHPVSGSTGVGVFRIGTVKAYKLSAGMALIAGLLPGLRRASARSRITLA